MSLSLVGNFEEATGKWTYSLSGEVDIANAHDLREELENAYRKQAADIEIDASGLRYIDSTGLGTIIGVLGEMRENGHRIMLKDVRDNVKKLLKITNLDKVLC
ncbi:MAG: STAS domain-containing protein [Clostridiales Family XIII bacterium]|jgi:anti-sigma B factor antagonist|nr:STAS domain-containing protein [Clostridiales Family XIII bacterium]